MSDSTHHIMKRLTTGAAEVATDEVADPVTERQPQVTPSSSPSMAEVLANCLSANKPGNDSQPK